MQLNALGVARATGTGMPVVASQTIDMSASSQPGGGTTMWLTEREFRLAGAKDGIDTFTSLGDALAAARALSAGRMPGLAVVEWRGGYRVHDVHATSRTWWSSSPDGPFPPITRQTGRSSVPFAAGNLRVGESHGRFSPAVVRSAALVALVDADRVFVPNTDTPWAGRPRLVETTELRPA